MIIENNTFLGGHLVGLGKVRANGEVEYNFLEKPIHNKITSVGLDHLLQFAGSSYSSTTSSVGFDKHWAGRTVLQYNGYRVGALEYMAFGYDSNNTATSFTDTALQNQISGYSNTKYESAYALNGTYVNSYGNYSMRISHQSESVSQTTTINEIGWFGGYNTSSTIASETKVLFARVLLNTPIVLENGEYLITTYQLDLVNANITPSVINDFYGLKDSEGNTLKAEKKLYRAYENYDTYTGWARRLSESFINTNGEGMAGNAYSCFPAYVFYTGSGNTVGQQFAFSSSTSKTFPSETLNSSNGDTTDMYTFSATGSRPTNFNFIINDYTGIGSTNKYRDKQFISGAYNPNMLNYPDNYMNISYLRVNGMDYRFGYYDNGVWVPQTYRKRANQKVTITFRTRYSTEDTTLS